VRTTNGEPVRVDPGRLSRVHEPRKVTAEWDSVCVNSKSVWDRLDTQDMAFGLRLEDGTFFHLTSFAENDLPPVPGEVSALGRFLVRHSVFANILARRRGREEVTFYCLLGRPHGTGWDRMLDQMFLPLGAAPLNWRRKIVVETVRATARHWLDRGVRNFAFLDIGCGGGFDGLDLKRILLALSNKGVSIPDHRIINVDVDEKWLGVNERLAQVLLPETHRRQLVRRHVSIFDYLKSDAVAGDLAGMDNLIVSCNGFADFYDDAALNELYAGIRGIAQRMPEESVLVLPIAMRNPIQGILSEMVGFGYTARKKSEISRRVSEMFHGFTIDRCEKHSQITFLVRKELR
jgi:SAM-dependent methyltransferase